MDEFTCFVYPWEQGENYFTVIYAEEGVFAGSGILQLSSITGRRNLKADAPGATCGDRTTSR